MSAPHPSPFASQRAQRLAAALTVLFLATAVVLWIADLRASHESETLLLLLNLGVTLPASLAVALMAGRAFLTGGQSGLLLLGSAALMWGTSTAGASALLEGSGNTMITVHNLGTLAAAALHLGGLAWRRELRRPGRWLAAAYLGVLAAVILLARLVEAARLPLFFVPGEGGTPVRQIVLVASATLLVAAAGVTVAATRRRRSPFLTWYGLSLTLLAIGVVGTALQADHGSALGWTGRLAQAAGSLYLLVAVSLASRDARAWQSWVEAAEAVWRQELLSTLRRRPLLRWAVRYGAAAAGVALASLVRQGAIALLGPGPPSFLPFSLAVLIVALFVGLGPGLLGVGLTIVLADLTMFPPIGSLSIASRTGRLSLVMFALVGGCMCAITELYRHNRRRVTTYERELAAHQSRERLAVFAEATFEGIIESEGGVIVDCNEQAASMSGYAPEELKGMPIERLVAPADLDRVLAGIRDRVTTISEHELLRKDGTSITVETHGRQMAPDSARRHTAIRDITDRKRAEQALRESEERYRLFVETSNEGIWVADADDRTTFINAAMARMLGRSVEEMAGTPAADYTTPAELADHRRRMELLRQGVSQRYERRLVRKDGRVLVCELSAAPMFDAAGRFAGTLAVESDITDRKRSDQLLLAQRDLFRAVAEQASLPEMLRLCLATALQISGLDCGGVYLSTDGGGLRLMLATGISDEFVRAASDYLADAANTRLVMAAEPRYTTLEQLDQSVSEVKRREGLRALAVIPISREGRVLGCINVASHDLDEVPLHCRPQLETIASTAGLLISEAEARTSLQESEEIKRLFIEHAPAAVAMFDRNMRYLAVSRRWMSDFGLGDESVLGRSHYEVFPEIPEHWRDAHRRGLDGEVVLSERDRFVRAGGSVQWVRWEVRPWYLGGGAVGGILILTEEITQQVRAEEALRASSERYRVLAETMLHGVVHHDADGKVIAMNPAAERILGRHPGEFLGRTSEDEEYHTLRDDGSMFPGREHPAMVALRTGAPVSGVVMGVYNPREASYRWINVSAVPLFRAGDLEPSEVYAVFEDVTERREAERALRESEQRLRRVASAGRIGLYEWRPVADTAYWSPEVRELLGRDVAGSSAIAAWLECVHPDDRERVARDAHERLNAARAGRDSGSGRCEYRVVHADGTVLWIEAATTCERDGDDLVVRGSMRDVTERRRAEGEIRRHAESLRVANEELLLCNRAAVERELRMIELKREINDLSRRLGLPPRYQI
jgi:PAS domain S-box-containing protein